MALRNYFFSPLQIISKASVFKTFVRQNCKLPFYNTQHSRGFSSILGSASDGHDSNGSNDAAKKGADRSIEIEYQKEIEDITNMFEERQKRKQAKIGVVVSTKCLKTINVAIRYDKFYSKYHVTLKKTRKIMAHDEKERAQLGDIVRIVPCRPMSKKKRHVLRDILKRPKEASAVPIVDN